MKARGKLVSLLMALVCLLPIGMGLLGFGDSASAATPEKIDVTLHKKKMDDFPTGGVKNTGELMEGDDEFGKYDPLSDVEFQPWDVTDDFYRLLAAKNITGNETDAEYEAKVKEVMETAQASDFTGKTSAGNPDSTDVNGEVKFTGLDDRDADGRYRVYWFEETTGDPETHYSQLVLLMLPVKKTDDTVNKDIHLYPKNKIENEPEKELVDESGNTIPDAERHSYDVGKKIHYKASFVIPNQIGEVIKNPDGTDKQTRYSKLVFKDEIDKVGVRFESLDKIVIGGNNVPVDDFTSMLYTNTQYFNQGAGYLPTGKAGFEIAMKLNDATSGVPQKNSIAVAQHLDQYRGQKIEFFYSVSLTEDTEVDVEINNSFYVDMKQHDKADDKKEVDDTPVVTTGGKKFLKHEDGKESQGLGGAEFVIIKEGSPGRELYLKKEAGKWVWEAVSGNYDDAWVVTSNDDGTFEVKGLEYDNYKLREIKAPEGFKKGADVPFVITKDSYSAPATPTTKVPNISKGGFLPSTGGAGIIAFLVIGLSLMGIAIVRYRKTQHAA